MYGLAFFTVCTGGRGPVQFKGEDLATSKSAWKGRERQIASDFGTERTPLSGGNGKITRSDSLHEKLFIEAKLRKKHTAVTLFDDTAKLAKKEGKIPVVALCEKNRPGYYLLIRPEHLKAVAEEYIK